LHHWRSNLPSHCIGSSGSCILAMGNTLFMNVNIVICVLWNNCVIFYFLSFHFIFIWWHMILNRIINGFIVGLLGLVLSLISNIIYLFLEIFNFWNVPQLSLVIAPLQVLLLVILNFRETYIHFHSVQPIISHLLRKCFQKAFMIILVFIADIFMTLIAFNF